MENTDNNPPCEIVRLISSLVVKEEPAGNRTLYLVALAGVCQRWRQAAVEVHASVPLAFDGADNAGSHGPKATLLKFRKADVSKKRATFLGASKLLKGYADLTLTGESITDEILANISRANGHNLTSIKLLGASSVTDAGIVSLLSHAPGLKQFVLEDAGAGVTGTFIPAILQSCRQLETLHIEGAPGVSWSDLHRSGAWWPVIQQPADLQQMQLQLPPAASGSSSSSGASSASESSGSHVSAALQPAFSQDVDPGSTSADGTLQHSSYHRRHRRVSSDVSDALSGAVSDDGSVSAASDSTSISVPAAATAALAAQLQQSSLQDSSGGAAGGSSRQVALQSTQQQQAVEVLAQGAMKQEQRRGIACHTALRKLHVRFANADNLMQLIERCPGITELHLDGPAYNIQNAAAACPNIKRLALLVGAPHVLDAALFYLNSMNSMRGLELEIKGMMLSTEQLRVIGMLPLRELALDSHAYRQQPSMPRPQYSHLDNEGVKGLVDSLCQRMRSEMMPLKLSVCGATALKQEAVSALLRLPMLTAIDTGGCIKLTPMDRMRLVAKVKAGQGMLDSKNGTGGSKWGVGFTESPSCTLAVRFPSASGPRV